MLDILFGSVLNESLVVAFSFKKLFCVKMSYERYTEIDSVSDFVTKGPHTLHDYIM